MTDTHIENDELRQRLSTIAHGFTVAALVTQPSHTFGDGVAVVVFEASEKPTIALVVNGTTVAVAPLDAACGPLVADIIERGLNAVEPIKRADAADRLTRGVASVCLFVGIGQERPSVYGRLVEKDSVRSEPLFELRAAPREEVVH